MTYDSEITLVKVTRTMVPPGIPENTETYTNVLCNVNGVNRSADFLARQAKLNPEYAFVMHKFEYDNQRIVIYDGIRYAVLRTYPIGLDEIELTVETQTGVSGNAEK